MIIYIYNEGLTFLLIYLMNKQNFQKIDSFLKLNSDLIVGS